MAKEKGTKEPSNNFSEKLFLFFVIVSRESLLTLNRLVYRDPFIRSINKTRSYRLTTVENFTINLYYLVLFDSTSTKQNLSAITFSPYFPARYSKTRNSACRNNVNERRCFRKLGRSKSMNRKLRNNSGKVAYCFTFKGRMIRFE